MSVLSRETLDEMPEAIQRPRYDRDQLTPGIVHIGVGNFHRLMAFERWLGHIYEDGVEAALQHYLKGV